MSKKYVFILIAYLVMYLSGIVGIPIFYFIGMSISDLPSQEIQALANAYWLVFSFTIASIIILLLLRNAKPVTKIDKKPPLSMGLSILLSIGGIFLAFFAQIFAVLLETSIGIEPGSENTEAIISIITVLPLVILVSSILGPILEEIVFRKIIFGGLNNKFSFVISALISSVIFAIAHMDFTHIILYTAMGFTFAFLYSMTKRIIVPIISHVMMNTLVVLMQYVFKDDLEKYIQEAEKVKSFIGGFFS